MSDAAGLQPGGVNHCHRHPDREAYISCQRCGRPICPECMNDAAVGFHCPSCVAEGRKSVRSARTLAGGLVSTNVGAVSTTLIAINVVAFVAQLATGDRDGEIFRQGAMIAESGPFDAGGPVYLGVSDGGWWRLLTSAFLHLGFLHLAFNMYALYLFGPYVERALGTWRFIVAYLTMAVVASVFVYVLSEPRTSTVGASGAVFGLFAIALVLMVRARQDVNFLLILLAINAVLSFRPGVSWQGHLGGFIAGLVIASAIAYPPKQYRQYAQAAAILVLVVGSVAALVLRTAALTPG